MVNRLKTRDFFVVILIVLLSSFGVRLIQSSLTSVTISSFGVIGTVVLPLTVDLNADTFTVVDAQGNVIFSDADARAAIQWAVDFCEALGGGNVIVKNIGMDYEIAGRLFMKSGVTLTLEDGVVLRETLTQQYGIISFGDYYGARVKEGVTNSHLTSTGMAKLIGTGQAAGEFGIYLWKSNGNSVRNLEIYSMGHSLLCVVLSNDNVFENIYAHKWSSAAYPMHGVMVDGSSRNKFINVTVDAENMPNSRCCLLLIGMSDPCNDNEIIGGEFKNSQRNAIYLCGQYGAMNNLLRDFKCSGVVRQGYAGIKCTASYNRFENFLVENCIEGVVINAYPGISMGEGNYFQGTIRDCGRIGLELYVDGEGKKIADNVFDLVIDGVTPRAEVHYGIWLYPHPENSVIENNTFYVTIKNHRKGIVMGVGAATAFIRRNHFIGVVTNITEAAIESGTGYVLTENIQDNRFDVVLDQGATVLDHGLRNRINGVGKEAAGAGNSPTATLWDIGDIVINTDDNTAWIKDIDSTMTLLTDGEPLARFEYINGRGGLADNEVQFVDQSYDPDGNIVTWNWDFGDDLTSNEQNPRHNYSSAGNYTVSLTVTDDAGNADTITIEVPVMGT